MDEVHCATQSKQTEQPQHFINACLLKANQLLTSSGVLNSRGSLEIHEQERVIGEFNIYGVKITRSKPRNTGPLWHSLQYIIQIESHFAVHWGSSREVSQQGCLASLPMLRTLSSHFFKH